MSLILLSTWSIFLARWVKGIILRHFYYLHFFTDKLLLEPVGLPHVLDLVVHLVNFSGWMSQRGHSEPLLLLELFYQSTPWGGVGWWPM